jgi:tetratricopeptide (TPR) repeat protein
MNLKSWTACIVSTLLAVAVTNYLLADEPTEPEPVKNSTETQGEPAQQPAQAEEAEPETQRNIHLRVLAEYRQKFQDAKQLVDNGQYAEAIKPPQQMLLQQINLDTAERDPRVYLLLARCFAELKEYELALEQYSTATIAPGAASVDGLLADAYLGRANLYLKLSRLREAHDDFSHGVALEPLNPHMLYGRGLTHLELGQPKDAISSFDRAIQIDDGYALAYYDRGMAKAMLGQEAEAQEDLARAVQADDKNELAQRLANRTVELMHENIELKQNNIELKQHVATLKAEAAEVRRAGDDFKGQVGEMVDTLRQIRDLLAEPRGGIGMTGAGNSLNKGGF